MSARSLALLIVVASAPASAADMTPDQRAFFESEDSSSAREAMLRVPLADLEEARWQTAARRALRNDRGGESGPSVIPGKPDESLIVQAVRYDGIEMPPKKRLPDHVVNDFVDWVRMGAPDPRANLPKVAKKAPQEPLWSLQPISDPQPPKVQNTTWPRQSLDAFILAKLEQNGLNQPLMPKWPF
jgi:hypothetical protein